MRIAGLGISEAQTNFESLRGTQRYNTANDQEWDADRNARTAFGPMFRDCKVESIAVSSITATARWVFSCDTVPMAGTKAALLPLLRDAVAQTLTSEFTSTTDAQHLVLDDYRWDDRNEDSVSIGGFETDGVVTFSISVYHFITNGDSQ
jgi:hypothetical protein